ncbi:TonB-dependent siderophore receptor [Limnobacter sp.]|uniref:TonB-dependent siderophore receptor n=1 Tax=Limnobacter sp. TaxID=2003368 RepID=UPI00391C862D
MQKPQQPYALLHLLIVAALSGHTVAFANTTSPAGQTLPEVKVVEQTPAQENPAGPFEGYAASRSATATKTNTAIAETAQAISVIGRDQLEDQNANDLGQALRYTPGIQGEPFGVEPRFTFFRIRGFDASTTGLFRDGLKLSNPGFSISYGLEPFGAERIEVLRGPSSVLYGQASPGGLVNFVTRRPSQETHREFGIEVGSFDRKQATLDIGGALESNDEFSYRLTGLLRNSDTQVDFVHDDRIYIAPAITWKPNSDTSLTLLTHYQKDDTISSQALPAAGTLLPNPNGPIPRNRFSGEPGVDKYEREEFSVTSLLEHKLNDSVTLRQNTRYYQTDLNDVVVFSNSLQADQRTVDRAYFSSFGNLASLTLDNQLEYRFSLGAAKHTLLSGIDFQNVELDSIQAFGAAPSLDIYNPVYGSPVNIPAPFRNDSTEQQQLGFYLQDEIRYKQWIATLAGRYDEANNKVNDLLMNRQSRQDDSATTGRASLMYQFVNGVSPYLSYTESFLPALGTDANGRNFDPETGQQFEVGVKFQPNAASQFNVALFDLTRENFLTTNPNTFAQEQTGEARSKGIELEALTAITDQLNLIASYTYTDVEITRSTDPAELNRRPVQTPEHLASLWADYTLRGDVLNGVGIGLGARYLGSTFADASNTLKVPNATVFDASIHYDWKQARFSLNIQNLFDREYEPSAYIRGGTPFTVAAQERTVQAQVSYRW